MKTPKIKGPVIVVGIALLAAALFTQSQRHPAVKENLYLVKRAIDGDTILLATNERVRYIGINTPETKHPYKAVEYFGREAYLYNKKLVEGRWVRLELDAEKRDRYKRLLAYVYVGDLFVNAKLVEEGYAQVYTVPPNVKYQELFLKLQRQARENKKGLWGR
ncbi:MAG: thermonuclease family protein [Candidatus Omnitrophica bacterium]|nr:thermonuclease family protein [Candidatus Omnitrophota bacterium]